MNVAEFLAIYTTVAEDRAKQDEVDLLFSDLAGRTAGTKFEETFAKAETRLDRVIAIDAVAHEIHATGGDFVDEVFPDNTVLTKGEVVAALDTLAGLEVSNEMRRANRGYFTPLRGAEEVLVDLSKQVGQTVRKDIRRGIEQYKALLSADRPDQRLISKAALLTLARYYPDEPLYKEELRRRGWENADPMVVGGYASVELIDKEGHLITVEALEEAFGRFMEQFSTRNIALSHTDVQAGWALPCWINTHGEVFQSGVDGKGLYLLSEVRDDVTIAERVLKQIQEGVIRSYSIAGNALAKRMMTSQSGRVFTQVDKLDLLETSFCERPVNQASHFDLLKAEPPHVVRKPGRKLLKPEPIVEMLDKKPTNLVDYFAEYMRGRRKKG